MKKILQISMLTALALLMTGCFQVFHFLSLNPDGSISVQWRLTLSRALSKKRPGAKEGPNLQEKLKKANEELQAKLKGKAKDIKTSLINTKHEKGVAMELTLLKPLRLEKQDGLPVVPFYEPAKKRLTFFFRPKKQGASTLPIPPAPPKVEKREEPEREGKSKEGPPKQQDEIQSPRPNNQGMEELAKAILSSARYQILLGGAFAPKRAYIMDHNQNGKKTELEIRKLGSQYLIDFPFMNFYFTGQEGYDLIVELQ